MLSSELLSTFGEISFLEYVSEGIPHPVFHDDLVYKLMEGQMRSEFRLVGL